MAPTCTFVPSRFAHGPFLPYSGPTSSWRGDGRRAGRPPGGCQPLFSPGGYPLPRPRNWSGPGTPGRPSDTGAARSANGPATPITRSGRADDHSVPQRTPGPFRKLDALAVLTGPLLPAPHIGPTGATGATGATGIPRWALVQTGPAPAQVAADRRRRRAGGPAVASGSWNGSSLTRPSRKAKRPPGEDPRGAAAAVAASRR